MNWALDPSNPGWAYNTGGDVSDEASWINLYTGMDGNGQPVDPGLLESIRMNLTGAGGGFGAGSGGGSFGGGTNPSPPPPPYQAPYQAPYSGQGQGQGIQQIGPNLYTLNNGQATGTLQQVQAAQQYQSQGGSQGYQNPNLQQQYQNNLAGTVAPGAAFTNASNQSNWQEALARITLNNAQAQNQLASAQNLVGRLGLDRDTLLNTMRQFDITTQEGQRQFNATLSAQLQQNDRAYQVARAGALLNAPRGPADYFSYTARLNSLRDPTNSVGQGLGGAIQGASGQSLQQLQSNAPYTNTQMAQDLLGYGPGSLPGTGSSLPPVSPGAGGGLPPGGSPPVSSSPPPAGPPPVNTPPSYNGPPLVPNSEVPGWTVDQMNRFIQGSNPAPVAGGFLSTTSTTNNNLSSVPPGGQNLMANSITTGGGERIPMPPRAPMVQPAIDTTSTAPHYQSPSAPTDTGAGTYGQYNSYNEMIQAQQAMANAPAQQVASTPAGYPSWDAYNNAVAATAAGIHATRPYAEAVGPQSNVRMTPQQALDLSTQYYQPGQLAQFQPTAATPAEKLTWKMGDPQFPFDSGYPIAPTGPGGLDPRPYMGGSPYTFAPGEESRYYAGLGGVSRTDPYPAAGSPFWNGFGNNPLPPGIGPGGVRQPGYDAGAPINYGGGGAGTGVPTNIQPGQGYVQPGTTPYTSAQYGGGPVGDILANMANWGNTTGPVGSQGVPGPGLNMFNGQISPYQQANQAPNFYTKVDTGDPMSPSWSWNQTGTSPHAPTTGPYAGQLPTQQGTYGPSGLPYYTFPTQVGGAYAGQNPGASNITGLRSSGTSASREPWPTQPYGGLPPATIGDSFAGVGGSPVERIPRPLDPNGGMRINPFSFGGERINTPPNPNGGTRIDMPLATTTNMAPTNASPTLGYQTSLQDWNRSDPTTQQMYAGYLNEQGLETPTDFLYNMNRAAPRFASSAAARFG